MKWVHCVFQKNGEKKRVVLPKKNFFGLLKDMWTRLYLHDTFTKASTDVVTAIFYRLYQAISGKPIFTFSGSQLLSLPSMFALQFGAILGGGEQQQYAKR